MVGYDSSLHPLLSTRLHYAVPGLLQSPAFSYNTSLPSTSGWMFLTMSREWCYDPLIKVIPHFARNRTNTSPCKVEYNTDYVGQELGRIRLEEADGVPLINPIFIQ